MSLSLQLCSNQLHIWTAYLYGHLPEKNLHWAVSRFRWWLRPCMPFGKMHKWAREVWMWMVLDLFQFSQISRFQHLLQRAVPLCHGRNHYFRFRGRHCHAFRRSGARWCIQVPVFPNLEARTSEGSSISLESALITMTRIWSYINLDVNLWMRKWKRTGFTRVPRCTPMEAGKQLKSYKEELDEPIDPTRHRQLIGSLMQNASDTRPDISYSFSILS